MVLVCIHPVEKVITKNSTIEGVECSVSDRICNFLTSVKSEQEKVHLVPVSRESNIETLIFVFQTWI